jgi:hypothetical protein
MVDPDGRRPITDAEFDLLKGPGMSWEAWVGLGMITLGMVLIMTGLGAPVGVPLTSIGTAAATVPSGTALLGASTSSGLMAGGMTLTMEATKGGEVNWDNVNRSISIGTLSGGIGYWSGWRAASFLGRSATTLPGSMVIGTTAGGAYGGTAGALNYLTTPGQVITVGGLADATGYGALYGGATAAALTPVIYAPALALARPLRNLAPAPTAKFLQPIYRIYGGDASATGGSWTPLNPRQMMNPRSALGLPSGVNGGPNNTGEYLEIGLLMRPSMPKVSPAKPLHGNRGGATEYYMQEWRSPWNIFIIRRQIKIDPPF